MLNNFTDHTQQFAILIFVIFYIIYIQVAKRPVKKSRFFIFPIILIYLTVNSIEKISINLSTSLIPIFLLILLGSITGIASGFITKIFKGTDGILYQQGGILALIFLVITIPLRYGLRYSISSMPGSEMLNNTSLSYLIVITAQLVSRSITIILKTPEIQSLLYRSIKNSSF